MRWSYEDNLCGRDQNGHVELLELLTKDKRYAFPINDRFLIY